MKHFRYENETYLHIDFNSTGICIRLRKNSSAQTPLVIPSGTLNGQFLLLKLQKNNSVDTKKANIQLQLEGADGYTVTGDTSTLHAGSYGTYTISITNVQFI